MNYFALLGVKAFRGRTFPPEDASKATSTTVVISEGLWQRAFRGDPNILGREVVIAGEKKTIVGILPPGFSVTPWKMDLDV
jgi:putative ABC transport system permease protein